MRRRRPSETEDLRCWRWQSLYRGGVRWTAVATRRVLRRMQGWLTGQAERVVALTLGETAWGDAHGCGRSACRWQRLRRRSVGSTRSSARPWSAAHRTRGSSGSSASARASSTDSTWRRRTLCVDPPAHAIVLSVNEEQSQALDRTQPGTAMKKGRSDQDYPIFCGAIVSRWRAYGNQERHLDSLLAGHELQAVFDKEELFAS